MLSSQPCDGLDSRRSSAEHLRRDIAPMTDDSIEKPRPRHIPYWRLMADLGVVTPEVLEYSYVGAGTHDDPYVVEWIPNGTRNPMQFDPRLKWAYTAIVAFAVLIVSPASSAYAGSLPEILSDLNISQEAGTLGVSVFVFGFAVGPLLWAPLSEVIGRR